MAFQYLKRAARELETMCNDKIRRKGFPLKERRFRLDIRKKFPPLGVLGYCNRLPREAGDASSQEMSKAMLDEALSNLV